MTTIVDLVDYLVTDTKVVDAEGRDLPIVTVKTTVAALLIIVVTLPLAS